MVSGSVQINARRQCFSLMLAKTPWNGCIDKDSFKLSNVYAWFGVEVYVQQSIEEDAWSYLFTDKYITGAICINLKQRRVTNRYWPYECEQHRQLKMCILRPGGRASLVSSLTRHVPWSKPPFSLIPDPGQNKEDTSCISVVAYGVYVFLSRPIQFCLLTNYNFEKNAQDPADPAEPWIIIRVGFCRFSWGSNHFIK